MSKIVVHMPNWIGDVVMALPVLSALQKDFPTAEIGVAVPSHIAPLFVGNELASFIIHTPRGEGKAKSEAEKKFRTEVKEKKIDIAILLPNSFESAFRIFRCGIKIRIGYRNEMRDLFLTRSLPITKAITKVHMSEYYLQLLTLLGNRQREIKITLPLSNESLSSAELFISQNRKMKESTLFAFSIGAAFGTAKVWSSDYYKELANMLIEKYNAEIVLIGAPNEVEQGRKLGEGMKSAPLIPIGNLQDNAAILSKCTCFIGNDSGVMHIAAAVGVPTIGLYFATNPERNYPLGEKATYIAKQIECAYCGKRVCPLGHHKCAEAIKPNDVLEKIETLLSKSSVSIQ